MAIRYLFVAFLCTAISGRAQNLDSAFAGLQGLREDHFDSFVINGITIFTGMEPGPFNRRKAAKSFDGDPKIRAKDIIQSDSLLGHPTYSLEFAVGPNERLINHVHEIYIDEGDSVFVIMYQSHWRLDLNFKRQFAVLARERKIPGEVYQPGTWDNSVSDFNFAGRNVKVEGCKWDGANSLSCDNGGYLFWSSFSTMERAQEYLDYQVARRLYPDKSNPEIVLTDETIEIFFEGQEVRARRIVCVAAFAQRITSVGIVPQDTTYFVSANVRGIPITCFMGHSQKDELNASGLPALLAAVIRMK